MGNWFVNEGPKWIFILLYVLANIAVFLTTFFKYNSTTQYFYLKSLLGLSLPFARGAAACLNFNSMIILLPVCRNLLSFMRGTFRCCRRNMLRQLDKNITFHKMVAYVLGFFSMIHIGAHCFNVCRLIDGHSVQMANELTSALSSLPQSQNGSYVNPLRHPGVDPIKELLQTVPGITGIIITVCLMLIISSATAFMRHSFFEVFWYTHHLFAIYFIGLLFHGMQGVLRAQTNVAEHDPYYCCNKIQDWKSGHICEVPQFQSPGSDTWKWILIPVVLYICECIVRLYRSFQKVEVTKIVEHPSKVIEIQMKKSGFTMFPGQYIFLKCPKISKFEWHPYTLTSCPQEDHFSVHIRIVGDWTAALSDVVKEAGNEYSILPKIAVDGPFGTATEDIFRYQTVMFIGAGIGVTPYASVLKDIWHKYADPEFTMKVRKVYFYWICPDTQAFEWFSDLLQDLEVQIEQRGNPDFLECNIYLTRGWNVNQARNIVLHEEAETDVITGLRQKTKFGRPHWDTIFAQVAAGHQGTSVGVFFCGPKVLSHELHEACNNHSQSDVTGVHFFYNKENF